MSDNKPIFLKKTKLYYKYKTDNSWTLIIDVNELT